MGETQWGPTRSEGGLYIRQASRRETEPGGKILYKDKDGKELAYKMMGPAGQVQH